MKILISGSISIKELPPEAYQAIDKIMSFGWDIVIGDAAGFG